MNSGANHSKCVHNYVNMHGMKNESEQHTLTLQENDVNKRLDAVLSQYFPEYSRTQLQQWIKDGHVHLNEQTVKPNYKVQGGEIVTINVQKRTELINQAEAIPLDIIHEEDDFLVINKPIGFVVHPGAGNSNSTLLNALLHHDPALKNLPRAGIIHRLDKDTSGLLVIAKTEKALASLTKQMKNREISREYQAIVYGNLISGGTIDAPIGRHPKDRKRMAITNSGKPAITHYRISEKYPHHTRLKVILETGRTHQIRVHMAHIKHPIIGDRTYAGRIKLAKGMSQQLIDQIRGFNRQALHAFALGFKHPITNQPVRFECKLPDDMKQLITSLKADEEI